MSSNSWQQLVSSGQIDGTALNTSTTPTSIIPPHAKFTLPANFFSIGTVLRATVLGRVSNINPTPGNFTIDMRLGAVVAANGGALSYNTTQANTNVTFRSTLIATCRAIGQSTSANLMFQWENVSVAFSTLATTPPGILFGPASAPAVGTGFDSTVAQTVDIFWTHSISNANNNVQVHQYLLEALN